MRRRSLPRLCVCVCVCVCEIFQQIDTSSAIASDVSKIVSVI
jgi:hypothetical protein